MSTFNPETNTKEYEFRATEIMFKLKDEFDTFTADDFYRLARAGAMPPELIKKFSGALFKRFQAAAYIRQTGEFKLSERNGSSPLPVWQRIIEE